MVRDFHGVPIHNILEYSISKTMIVLQAVVQRAVLPWRAALWGG